MFSLYIIKAGLIAGIIMGMAAMLLNLIGFTKLDLTKYMGCMLTGHASGAMSFIAGFSMHVCMSIIFGFMYVWIANYLHAALDLKNGLIFGLIHGIISGIMLPILDNINHCVALRKVPAMKIFGLGYGINSTITLVIGHIIYGISFVLILSLYKL